MVYTRMPTVGVVQTLFFQVVFVIAVPACLYHYYVKFPLNEMEKYVIPVLAIVIPVVSCIAHHYKVYWIVVKDGNLFARTCIGAHVARRLVDIMKIERRRLNEFALYGAAPDYLIVFKKRRICMPRRKIVLLGMEMCNLEEFVRQLEALGVRVIRAC